MMNKYVVAATLFIIGTYLYLFSDFTAWFSPFSSKYYILIHPLTILCYALSIVYLIGEKRLSNWFTRHPVRFYLVGIIFSSIVILPLGIQNSIDYKKDVLVEAHGLIFDLLVFGILLSIYDQIKASDEKKMKEENEKQAKIALLLEEIDEIRDLNTDESKFKIRGNIIKLNRLGQNEINLNGINLSDFGNNNHLNGLNLNKSYLFRTDFSRSTMDNAQFSEITCSNSYFNGKNFLQSANFQKAHIQYSEFEKAYLVNSDFSDASLSNVNFKRADLRGVSFERTYFFAPNFDGAEVDKNFLEKLKSWNITGHPIYDWYDMIEREVPGHSGHFQYFLKEKPGIDKKAKVEL